MLPMPGVVNGGSCRSWYSWYCVFMVGSGYWVKPYDSPSEEVNVQYTSSSLSAYIVEIRFPGSRTGFGNAYVLSVGGDVSKPILLKV